MLKSFIDKIRGKKKEEEIVEVESVETKKSKGRGYKTHKHSLTKFQGGRYRFNYRFDKKLELVCICDKEQEEEVLNYIEDLISKGYDKEEIITKCKIKFHKRLRGVNKKKIGKGKSTTKVGRMNNELSWNNDGILLYNDKKTNITPQILQMFCTFHSHSNNNYDLIDLINQQYRNENLLGSAVSFICINYNSLNLSKLIEEGVKCQ